MTLSLSGEEEAELLELIGRYDAPVIASYVKLWLVEAEGGGVIGSDGWEEVRKVYGASKPDAQTGSVVVIEEGGEKDSPDETRVKEICEALQSRLKLTRGNLYVLDAAVGFWRRGISNIFFSSLSSPVPSEFISYSLLDETLICKLGLTLGRSEYPSV
jgi:hypothetical protein